MDRLHPAIARRLDRWLDRWGRAFVMEVECGDGSRYLIGLDPHWHGSPMMAVPGDDGGGPGGDPRVRGTWAEGSAAPDDLRDLVP